MKQNIKELASIGILISLLNADQLKFKPVRAAPVAVVVEHEAGARAKRAESAAVERHAVKDDNVEELVADDAVEEGSKVPVAVAATLRTAVPVRGPTKAVPWYLEPPYQAPLYRYVPREFKRN